MGFINLAVWSSLSEGPTPVHKLLPLRMWWGYRQSMLHTNCSPEISIVSEKVSRLYIRRMEVYGAISLARFLILLALHRTYFCSFVEQKGFSRQETRTYPTVIKINFAQSNVGCCVFSGTYPEIEFNSHFQEIWYEATRRTSMEARLQDYFIKAGLCHDEVLPFKNIRRICCRGLENIRQIWEIRVFYASNPQQNLPLSCTRYTWMHFLQGELSYFEDNCAITF